jgi:hypothetical protein
MSSRSDRSRAEAVFKKEERARQGQIAMSQYVEQQEATRAKTARLRALRLAREAEQPTPTAKPGEGSSAPRSNRRSLRGLHAGSRVAHDR